MALYDKASLVLIPSGTKEGTIFSQKPTNGDGDFTFSRSTSATRVGPSGYIEKETQNLLLQSNSFDTTWANSNSTETGGQSGYDGSSDAWLFSKSAATGYIYQNATTNGVATFSVYAKAGSLNWIRVQVIDASGNPNTFFDLQNGLIGVSGGVNRVTSNLEDIGGGWYRCSITYNATQTQVRIYPADGNNDVSGTSGSIYIQDAQLEQGLVARDYIETTTSAVYGGITDNIPRLDYNGSCPSLLLEPQRSNIVVSSEYLSHSSWANVSCTITTNNTISPEGLENATLLSATGSTSNRMQDYFGPLSTVYTHSVYIKSTGTATRLNLQTNDSGGLTLDVPASGIPTIQAQGSSNISGSVFIEAAGTDGWYRVGFSYTPTGGAVNNYFQIYPDSQNGTGSILLWGIQAEEGSYATSYIPTYGASVTFASDACNSAGNASTFNDSEGVLYAEVAALYDDGTNRVMTISDGTLNNRIAIAYTPTGNQVRGYLQGSSTITLDYIVSNILEFNKIAVKYKSNDISLWVNGVEVGTSTSAFSVSGLSELAFDRGDGNLPLYSKTKQILYFPTALTDEELADLTQV